ncbi:hypothetical protein [Rickettsia endosymbiont of Polydrusus tereticollis]|uniref:hypothetical protein n=1 Tax=Rickettsia endosymbiont of Polydrusus tereticollis TaxID=3066251 RepID=UPI003133253E
MKEKSANDIVTIEKLFKLFELMQKEHVTAWNILLHSSYLGTNSIPVEILTSLFDKTVIDTKIELGFWVLMQQEQSENKIKLTESILEAVNKYYPPNDRGYTQEIEIYKNLIKALDTIFPEINKEQEKEWEKAKILYTYAEKILKDCENKKLLITNTELANLYNKLAAYNQFIKHDLQQSYQYYEKVLEINKAFNSSHELKLQDLVFDRLIATARYNAGIIGVELYPYKAQDYLKSYIKPAYEVKKSLNPNHPDIAAYLESIEIIKGKIKQLEQDQNISPLESAIVDYNQGIAYLNKAEEQNDNTLKKSSLHLALPFLEQGFKKFCKMHKDKDIEGQYIFKALYDIGRVYYDLGDQNKSLELFIEAYITRGKYKGAYENELKTYFSKMDSQDAGKLLTRILHEVRFKVRN